MLARQPVKELLTAREVAERLSIGLSTLWRMLARGELPQPIRYNRRLVRWRTRDLATYLESLQVKTC